MFNAESITFSRRNIHAFVYTELKIKYNAKTQYRWNKV